MITVYISIGNSDDKLSQVEWSHFYEDVDELVDFAAARVHGRWLSVPSAAFQNACWCCDLHDDDAENLRRDLGPVAERWQQESIAWAVAATEFIAAPSGGPTGGTP